MTTPLDSIFFQAAVGDTAVSETAQQYRLLPDAVFASAGVTTAGGLKVTQHAAGANYTVDVAAGIVVVQGTSATNQGKYIGRNAATQSVTVGAAPSSGTRTDMIVAQVKDGQVDASHLYQITLVCVAGPDTSGTVPTLPANAYALATISVAAGQASIQTANITDKRALVTHPGQDVWVGGEGTYVGTAPTAGARKIRYSGTLFYTTNTFGQFAVTFPTAFPNGLVNLMFTPGNVASSLCSTIAIPGPNTTLSTGVGVAKDFAGALITSLAVQVQWLAEGW